MPAVATATGAVPTVGQNTKPWYGLWHGDVDPSVGVNVKDQEMATSIGGTTPIATFRRGYSGNSHPNTFAGSSVSSATTYAAAQPSGRFGAMLNTKFGDWAALAAGTYDAQIAGFYNSWPTNIYGVVTVNHEPENDGPAPANRTNSTYVTWAEANGPVFCAGVRRYIDVAAPIIRSRGLDVKVGGCLMDFSWDVIGGTQRYIDWKWWEGITPANLGQVDFGIDAYSKTTNTGGVPVGYPLDDRLDEILVHMRAAGIDSFSLYETANDRRLRNGGDTLVGTDESVAAWIPGFVDYIETQIPEARMICWFHTPTGPASAQAYLAGPATPAWANVCMNGRRP